MPTEKQFEQWVANAEKRDYENKEYKAVKEGIEEAKELIKDAGGDEEMSELAKAELEELEGKVEQRTVFPPDGYQIWAPLSADMRFTWKTNVSIAHHIQIARDEQFNSIVHCFKTNFKLFRQFFI